MVVTYVGHVGTIRRSTNFSQDLCHHGSLWNNDRSCYRCPAPHQFRPAILYLDCFARWRLWRRTPGPPPFSSMNSTPANHEAPRLPLESHAAPHHSTERRILVRSAKLRKMYRI